MKDPIVKLEEMLLHKITFTFPLGYFLENDLVPTASEKSGRKQAFENFEKNWKQLIDESNEQSPEGYHMDSELSSETSKKEP